MFVKWECGCIGIKIVEGCIMLKSCYDETGEFTFEFREELQKKEYEPLTSEEVILWMTIISRLVSGCQNLETIKRMLIR